MIALLLVVLLAPASAAAQDATVLGEDEAAERAIAVRPELRGADAMIGAAIADRDAASLAFVPEIALGAHYTRLSELPADAVTLDLGESARVVLPQLLDQHAARAELVIPASELMFARARALDAAGERVRAEQLRREAAVLRVAGHARRLHVALALAEARVRALGEIEARHALLCDEVRTRVRAGLAPDLERLEAVSARLAVVRELRAAEAERARAERALAALVGLPDVRLATPGLPAQTPEPEAGLEAAVASRADVESRRAARRALVAGADAERAASLPRVDLVAGLDVATPAPRAFAQSELRALATWDLGVRVSFSLERALAAFSRAERLEREADVLVAEEDASLRDARLEIATARAEHAALGAARGSPPSKLPRSSPLREPSSCARASSPSPRSPSPRPPFCGHGSTRAHSARSCA